MIVKIIMVFGRFLKILVESLLLVYLIPIYLQWSLDKSKLKGNTIFSTYRDFQVIKVSEKKNST